GSANRMSAPYQAVHAQDGYFVLGAANQKLWKLLCNVLGRPDLLADARFSDNSRRLANRRELIAELEKTFETKLASVWVEELLAAGIPAGPINTYAEALDNEHSRERCMVMEIMHPAEGAIKL